MNEKILSKDELIGLHVKIKECNDPSWQGKTGVVVNETKNTFLIKIDEKTKKKQKKKQNLNFEMEEKK